MPINEKAYEVVCSKSEFTDEVVRRIITDYESAKTEQPVRTFEKWALENMPDGVNPELWRLVKKAWDASPKRESGSLKAAYEMLSDVELDGRIPMEIRTAISTFLANRYYFKTDIEDQEAK